MGCHIGTANLKSHIAISRRQLMAPPTEKAEVVANCDHLLSLALGPALSLSKDLWWARRTIDTLAQSRYSIGHIEGTLEG